MLYDFPNGDKVGHFILFGLLNFFITRAFLSSLPSKPRGWVALSVGLILALFIALEEWSQKFFSTRTSDIVDLLASYTGIVTFAFLAVYWRKSRL
jgi:polysaccharide biosynthesis protein VpsQ